MPQFQVRAILNYGLNHPIVARLSLQVFDILKECDISLNIQEELQKIYLEQLMPQLIKLWEIENWYRNEFNEQVRKYEVNINKGNNNHLPFISRIKPRGLPRGCSAPPVFLI